MIDVRTLNFEVLWSKPANLVVQRSQTVQIRISDEVARIPNRMNNLNEFQERWPGRKLCEHWVNVIDQLQDLRKRAWSVIQTVLQTLQSKLKAEKQTIGDSNL